MQILFEGERDHLVSIFILPNVNSFKLNRDAKQVTSAYSRTPRLKNNQVKSQKKSFYPQNGQRDDSWVVSGKPWGIRVLGSIRRVRFTQSTLRQASIRENKGPSLGKVQVKIPHQRSPYAFFFFFENRSPEETERQERCARDKAWNLARHIYKLKDKDKATFHSPTNEWIMPAASTIKPEEREFVVDSGASMHMVSK